MSNVLAEKPIVADVAEIISDCEAWARHAAPIAREAFCQRGSVRFKQDESPVTVTDELIEQELKKAISSKYPKDGIFGEETGIEGDTSQNLWIIDPIDGTRSFISGNPLFGLLLAYVEEGRPVAGTISMPVLEEVYSGGVGRQATLNGALINVSGQTDIDDCILYINEGEKLLAERPEQLKRLLEKGRTRRFGYDCYPHALLAAGRIDAVVDYDLKPYDFFALTGVIEAAGGVITDWNGNKLGLSSDGTVVSAASPELHRSLLEML
ncbi:inositol monophosphatase family protein [Roseibium sp.]|uniref:inositol monophosphatase family protein n=1 Tax=Roseibium sp. TaxID=1936156 RepID=UPI003B529CA0